MANCAHCGAEIIGESFYCSQCGQKYCNYHRDPIDHDCNVVREGLGLQQLPTTTPAHGQAPQISTIPQEQTYHQEVAPSIVRGTTDGTYTWFRQEAQVPVNAFDPDSGIKFKGILLPYKSEFIHLIIGSVLIYLIGFLLFYDATLVDQGYGWAMFMLAGFYMTAFLFHEFGHRQVALHFKLQTKFRLLTFGMVLTFFALFSGLIKLITGSFSLPIPALPGAIVVLGLSKVDKTTGLCKAAGPFVNLVYGIILFIISFLIPNSLYPLNYFIEVSAYLNFMLGAFNMLPIGILDGQNIWKWNKKVYIFLISSLGVLLIVTFIIMNTRLSLILYSP